MSAPRWYLALRRASATLWDALREGLSERRARRLHLRQLERIFG